MTSKIIIFASHLDPAEFGKLDWTHVDGYLLWGDLSPALLPHFLAVAVGGDLAVYSQTVTAHIRIQCRTLCPDEGRIQLTKREQAVLRQLAEGLTHKQIARVQSLSLRTVDRIVANVEAKLAAPSQFVLELKACRV